MPTAGPIRHLPDLETLRARIARLEADSVPIGRDGHPGSGPVALGLPALDATLGGGIARGALHEIRSADADGALAFGFALALTARLVGDGPGLAVTDRTLIVTTFDGAGEWGRPYGPGLAAFGLDPARLLMVEARRPRDALWAAEEGLASRALAAVVAEIRGDPALVDLTATRRLALRAARSGVSALLVRPGTGEGLSAARTRWRVRPPQQAAPGDAAAVTANPAALPFTLPLPAWHAELERNAGKPGGSFCLMWNSHERIFADAPPQAVAGTPVDAPVDVTDRTGTSPPGTTLPRPSAAASAGGTADGTANPGEDKLPLRRAG